ncbi:MAG TPA: hypothetical protein VHO94_06390 [Oscillospiraceae bacterium]|nr:hypothetical protein [Oscillospiraceae bacterium]
MDSTKKDFSALFLHFSKVFVCLVLCVSILLTACRTNETQVHAVTGVDDAAEIFAGAGIAYEIGLVIVAGLVACGMSFSSPKDAAQAAVQVYNKGNASFKQQAINTANVSAATGMAFCTWEAAGWSDFCNGVKSTFNFTTLTNTTEVVNIPIRTLANTAFKPFVSVDDSWSGTPTFSSTATEFLASDSGISFGMSSYYPMGVPCPADFSKSISTYPDCDSYYYYLIPALGLSFIGICARNKAHDFWYRGAVAFYGANNSCMLGDSGYGPWSRYLLVNGQRLLVNDRTDLVSCPSDGFTCTTADGVAFPQTGGDVIKGKWSNTQEWWKSLAAAAAAGSIGARLKDKNYYPDIDDVLNPTNKETKLKTDTTVQKEIDKTAEQTRDVQAAPTTSTATSTANSDITGGNTSSSPTSNTTSKLVDGDNTNSSGINGNASNDLNSLMGLIDTLKAFFAFLAKAFSYLPPEFWILVIGGLVVVIILRVAGR